METKDRNSAQQPAVRRRRSGRRFDGDGQKVRGALHASHFPTWQAMVGWVFGECGAMLSTPMTNRVAVVSQLIHSILGRWVHTAHGEEKVPKKRRFDRVPNGPPDPFG